MKSDIKVPDRSTSLFFWTLAVLSGFRFRIVGDFYIGELFSVLILVSNFFSKENKVQTRSRLDKFGYLWVITQVISNLVNHTSEKKFLISIGSALFTIAIFKSFFILAGKGYSPYKILLAVFLGQTVAGILQPKDYGVFNGWKFQYGYFLGTFIVILLMYKNKVGLGRIALILFIGVSLMNSARSLAAFFLISLLLSFPISKKNISDKSVLKIFGRIVFLLVFLSSIYWGYLVTAKAGYLGEKEIFRAEHLTTTIYGPLIGRSEIFYSIQAIYQQPLIGYGGNPIVDNSLLLQISTNLYEHGARSIDGNYNSPESLPIHSILLGTAIFAGVPASIFWLYCLTQSAWCILGFKNFIVKKRVCIVLIAISQIWNILFSPYGALLRLSISSSVAFIYLQYTSMQSKKFDLEN